MSAMPDATREQIRDNRGWLTALGVALAALGALAIVMAFAATLATVVLFGALLLVAGVAQLAQAVSDRGDDFGWDLASGLLYLVAGGLLVFDPVSGAVGLTLLLVLLFFFLGAVRLSLARRVKRMGGASGALTLTGVLDLLLGLLILLGWPGTASWVIGLFLGIELLMAGVSLVVVSRGVGRRQPTAVV